MSGHGEWEIGRHLFHFEPPDILWVKYRGPFSLQEAIRMVDLNRELAEARPYFMVGDMREAGPLESEARVYFSEHLRFEWFLRLLYIGGRLRYRATAKGILLAAYLTESTTDDQVPDMAHFVSSMEEACALLVQWRADAVARPLDVEGEGALPPGSPVRGPSW